MSPWSASSASSTSPRLPRRGPPWSALASGGPDLELDLTAVDFVDSLGLGVVVSALKRVRSRGGHLVVVAAADRVRKPFELTGLDALVDLRQPIVDGTAPSEVVDG